MADLSCIPKLSKQVIVLTWAGQLLKLMLLNKNHVPNAGTQQYVSDVVANEVVDPGDIYTAGGVTIEGLQAVADPNNLNNYFLDGTDVSIGPRATLDYRFGIVYQDMGTGNHSVNPIRAQIDFLEDQIIVNGISDISWNALGIIYIS
jgi:hypothetical protein